MQGRELVLISLALLVMLLSPSQAKCQEISYLSISIKMISPEEVEEVIEFSAEIGNSSSIIFPISYDVSDLQAEAYYDEESFPLKVRLQNVRGKNFIVLTAKNILDKGGVTKIKLVFRARGMIERASDKYIFSQSFSVPYDIGDMTVSVVLPSKFSILSPIYPSPETISTVGKQVIVVWSYGPVKAKQEKFLILGFRENYSRFFWVPYAVLSLITSFLAGLFVGRKLSKPSRLGVLADEERILQVLRKRKTVTQVELVQILGFSKAKLSKLLNQMEKDGLIRREKYKKTFIISLPDREHT